jgi:chorismate mutase
MTMIDKTVNKSRISQEHVEIEQITASLHQILAERQETQQRVLDLLNRLRERVAAHFSDEEVGGFISEQTRDKKELAAKCRSLCKHHTCLTEQLDHLIALAEGGAVQPEWWSELEARFHELSVEIAGHEFREQELLSEVDDDTSSGEHPA